MTNTHRVSIRITNISDEAYKSYLFQDMTKSLVSIGKLCDDGFISLFDKEQVDIIKDNVVLLLGTLDLRSVFWHVDFGNFSNAHFPGSNILQYTANHRWDLPVLHYHKIMVIYPYPFLVVITQFFSWVIFINCCIFIFTGSSG